MRGQCRRRGQTDEAVLAYVGHGDTGALKLIVPEFLDGFKVERLLDAHTTQDLAEDRPGWPAVEAWRDDLVAHGEEGDRAVHLSQNVGALKVGRFGQDDVGKPAGLRIAHIDRDKQFQLVQRRLIAPVSGMAVSGSWR